MLASCQKSCVEYLDWSEFSYDYDYEWDSTTTWYEFCSTEGEDCECMNEIVYGAYDGENFDWDQAYVSMDSDESGSTVCNNEYFTDPLPGVGKACFCATYGGDWDYDYDFDYDYDLNSNYVDEHESCGEWAMWSPSECILNQDYMLVSCQYSCSDYLEGGYLNWQT